MRAPKHTALFAAALVLGFAACEGGGEAGTEEEMPATEEPQPAQPAPGGQQAQVPDSLPEGVTAEMVAQGGDIFHNQGLCYTCHGQNAQGGPLAPNLTDDEWLNVETGAYQEIVELVKTGVPQPVQYQAPMPPMGGASLNDQQVQSVAAYVWAQGHLGG